MQTAGYNGSDMGKLARVARAAKVTAAVATGVALGLVVSVLGTVALIEADYQIRKWARGRREWQEWQEWQWRKGAGK